MVRFGLFAASFALLALTVTAAAERRVPGGGGYILKPLVMPLTASAPKAPAAPYPMTYSEQVAISLGVRDGGLALNPMPDRQTNPYAPSVSFNGNMLRMRWRP